jgi:hypothetical protein
MPSSLFVILSGGGAFFAPPESKDLLFRRDRILTKPQSRLAGRHKKAHTLRGCYETRAFLCAVERMLQMRAPEARNSLAQHEATGEVLGRVGEFVAVPQPRRRFATPSSIRDYMAEAEAALQVQPEDIELEEIMQRYGYKQWDHRAKEHQRDERRRRQRKYFRANYDRFVAEANARNIQNAAERLYQERIAAERAETSGCPIPASVAGVGVFPTAANPIDNPGTAAKRPPTSSLESTPEEAKNTA